MKFLRTASLLWAGLLWSFAAWGQHVPLGVLPMEYNGSFAGEAGDARLNLNSSYLSEHITGIFKNRQFAGALSYDQFVPSLRSGVGVYAGFAEGNADLHTTTNGPIKELGMNTGFVGLSIAPKISIKGKHTLSPSISLLYREGTSKEDGVERFNTWAVGSTIGLLWNTANYYIGFSFNGPSYVEVNGVRPAYNRLSNYHFYSTLQAGYTFQRSPESHFSFTPQIVVSVTKPFWNETLNFQSFLWEYIPGYNLNFRYKKFIWGVNNEGIHVGLQTEQLRLIMTNDLGFFNFYSDGYSQLDRTHYAGNLSFRYIFKKEER